jgi:UDP-N-acetylglucosamine/UDP-N-acetylgalactosamine diphosphorylase
MLREPPVFLGGQGGLVGPAKIDYGTVIPAGIICRQDCTAGEMPAPSPVSSSRSKIFFPGVYGDVNRKVRNNIEYVANLLALKQWYRHVRRNFFTGEKDGEALYTGACDILDGAIAERLKQLRLFVQNLDNSMMAGTKILKKRYPDKVWRTQKQFLHDWPKMEAYLSGNNEEKTELKKRDSFVNIMESLSGKGNSYLEAIKLLTPAQAQKGTGWLKDIVDNIMTGCIPNFHASRQKEK